MFWNHGYKTLSIHFVLYVWLREIEWLENCLMLMISKHVEVSVTNKVSYFMDILVLQTIMNSSFVSWAIPFLKFIYDDIRKYNFRNDFEKFEKKIDPCFSSIFNYLIYRKSLNFEKSELDNCSSRFSVTRKSS